MKYTQKSVGVTRKRNGQSDFVLSLNILEGMLDLNPLVRDSASNVIPGKKLVCIVVLYVIILFVGQQGELVINLSKANVFIVSGYKGDADLGYVCVQVNNAQLYHSGKP